MPESVSSKSHIQGRKQTDKKNRKQTNSLQHDYGDAHMKGRIWEAEATRS